MVLKKFNAEYKLMLNSLEKRLKRTAQLCESPRLNEKKTPCRDYLDDFHTPETYPAWSKKTTPSTSLTRKNLYQKKKKTSPLADPKNRPPSIPPSLRSRVEAAGPGGLELPGHTQHPSVVVAMPRWPR